MAEKKVPNTFSKATVTIYSNQKKELQETKITEQYLL